MPSPAEERELPFTTKKTGGHQHGNLGDNFYKTANLLAELLGKQAKDPQILWLPSSSLLI